MIIEIINVQRVVVGETEDDPPIGADGHGPKVFELALQGVQPETRQVHVSKRTCRIETREYVTQLHRVFGDDAPWIIVFVKALQPFVSNRPDHCSP